MKMEVKYFMVLLWLNSVVVCLSLSDNDGFDTITTLDEFVDDNDNYTRSDVETLINDKLDGYNKRLRPKLDYAKPMHIKVGFSMSAIQDFDEVEESFSIVGILLLQWIDDKMKWNESEYSGIKTFITENEDYWTPTLILVNAFGKFEVIGKDPYWPIRFTYTGHVLYFPGGVFTSSCPADVTYYPWDTQRCSLVFTASSHLPNEIQVFPFSDDVMMRYYERHGEWDIIDTKVESQLSNLQIVCTVTFKRKPQFIVLNVILPIVLLSALNTFVFLIPTESGERISYGMTVLLAITVFLTIIGNNLPESARSIAILCYYLLFLLTLSILMILGTIINLRLYFATRDRQVPNWCCQLLRRFRCRARGTRLKKPQSLYERKHNGINGNKHEQSASVNAITDDNAMNASNTCARDVGVALQLETKETVNDNDERTKPCTTDLVNWKEVSAILDIVFFVFAWVLIITFTLWFFVYVTNY